MPGPHTPYTHPGPSNYYHHPQHQQPQQPPYGYPAMNGPSPGPYPYGYPSGPPHLNGNPPHGSPRGRTFAHQQQPYPVPPYHGPYSHPHHPPPPPQQQQQPSPHTPHQQPQKFLPAAFQHHPAAAHHSPSPQSWTAPSPLPKHLAMPPPPSLSPLSGHPPRPRIFDGPLDDPEPPEPAPFPGPPPPQSDPSSVPDVARSQPQAQASPTPQPRSQPQPEPEPEAEAEAESQPAASPKGLQPPSTPSFQSASTVSAPAPAPAPGPSAPASRPSASPSAPSTSTSTSPATPSTVPTTAWAIWSRRPDDPSRAPAIIFSPSTCPPQSIVAGAISARTPPPPSPPPPKSQSPVRTTAPAVPSSDVSSAPPDTPMPGSPVSSSTSVSGAVQVGSGASPKPSPSPAPAAATSVPVPVLTPNVAEGVPGVEVQAPTPAVGASPAAAEEVAAPAPPADSSAPVEAPSPAAVPAAAQPPASPAAAAPAPSAPAPAGPRKSWAELLRSTDGASSSTSKLPTSSVIGFSVPASPPPARVPPTKRTELAALLAGRAPPPASGSSASATAIRPRGLVNSGNMCFANSVLQLLVYSAPFWRLFKELGRLLGDGQMGSGVGVGGQGETPLVDATARCLREFEVDGGQKGEGGEGEEDDGLDSFMPTYVYEAMKEKKRFDNMRGQHQEDAEEFFGFYLDTLEEELLALAASLNPRPQQQQRQQPKVIERVEETPPEEGWMEVGKRNRLAVTRTVKTQESPITRIFGGKFRSTLRVSGQRDSSVIEDWRSLQLDIQKESVHTIRDALSALSTPQAVEGVSPSRTDGSQQVLIDALPPVLVLHLKRFLYDVDAKGVVKLGKKVAFGPELEIPSEVISPAAGKRVGSRRYRLYGVLYHHGISAGGGHYTLDVLHPNRDLVVSSPSSAGRTREAWIRFDDELVSDVRAEDVFGFAAQERDDRSAYLLFYKQVPMGGAGAGSVRT